MSQRFWGVLLMVWLPLTLVIGAGLAKGWIDSLFVLIFVLWLVGFAALMRYGYCLVNGD